MTSHVEELLPPAIRANFAGVRVVTETPKDLEDVAPLVQVVGIGGSGDRLQFETQRVDIDVFDVARDGKQARENARALAQSIHDWLLRDLPGQMLGSGSFVLSVTEFLAPIWTPYDNTQVRRFALSVQLNLHVRSAT